jgi:hypothetical protein
MSTIECKKPRHTPQNIFHFMTIVVRFGARGSSIPNGTATASFECHSQIIFVHITNCTSTFGGQREAPTRPMATHDTLRWSMPCINSTRGNRRQTSAVNAKRQLSHMLRQTHANGQSRPLRRAPSRRRHKGQKLWSRQRPLDATRHQPCFM